MAKLGLELNCDRFLGLLKKLIGESESLQNNPPRFVPTEDNAIKHVKALLEPYTVENGGALTVEHVTYVKNRGNLILGYCSPGAVGTVGFVGSHLDVVPANPADWDRNPFELVVEGDKLYGRGTTDCLGHVALLTDIFIQLAEKKPKLKRNIWAIFIACEENSTIPDVGVDMMLKDKRLDMLKDGPIFWVDSADGHPCIGTASAIVWTMRVEGRLFHSGLPHKGINSIELASDVIAYLQKRFYADFPKHPEEEKYKFATPSTMKPTQIRCSEGAVNQIPSWVEVKGDLRITPFYDLDECRTKMESYVHDLNQDINQLLTDPPTHGPCSKYEITDTTTKEHFVGKVTFKFEGQPFKGIACNLESEGFKHLDKATEEVRGESKPYSICGSLPLVGDLQLAGFDVQVCGYGHSHVYHGNNEYCSLSCMQEAAKILSALLDKFN